MGLRLRHNEWQRQLWKFITHPVTEILGMVALVLVAFGTLIASESRSTYGPHVPVVFSPK
jgi:hypothetical protein